jgi:hypothetical protein
MHHCSTRTSVTKENAIWSSANSVLNRTRNRSTLSLMLKFIPNILTFARFALTFIFLGMILYSSSAVSKRFFLDIAFVLFVIAELTDIVDGKIARKFKVASRLANDRPAC